MSSVGELTRRAREIHHRLINPPNAVKDIGIDLKRKPKPKVLENPIASCHVQVTIVPSLIDEYKPLKLQTIINAVAADFGITVAELMGESRQKRVSVPRFVACHLGFKHTGMSMAAIGRRLNRDHTAIMHAIRSMKLWLANGGILAMKVLEIEGRLLSLPYDPRTHCYRPTVAPVAE